MKIVELGLRLVLRHLILLVLMDVRLLNSIQNLKLLQFVRVAFELHWILQTWPVFIKVLDGRRVVAQRLLILNIHHSWLIKLTLVLHSLGHIPTSWFN